MVERTPELDGRVVVVTGTSKGIGTGIARRCLEAGASVVGVSRSGSPELSGVGDRFLNLRADLTDSAATVAVANAAVDKFGRVDGLVNNAGVLFSANCWEQTDEEWDAMVATNVDVPFVLSQALAEHWLNRDDPGTIVNICSIESDIGWKDPPQAGYAATKGALLGLTRAMALDLAPRRVRVSAVGPGVINTEMTPPGLDPEQVGIPLRELGTPEQIGDAVVFLLSDRARYITGEILYVDGGYKLL